MVFVLTLLFAIATLIGICMLLAYPFMWGWNYAVVTAVDFANPIDYWVALVLMLFIGAFISGSSSGSKK